MAPEALLKALAVAPRPQGGRCAELPGRKSGKSGWPCLSRARGPHTSARRPPPSSGWNEAERLCKRCRIRP